MNSATAEAPTQETGSTVRDRVGDVARQAAHISQQAQRAFTSVQRRVEEFGDLKAQTADRLKRQPFAAVGLAAGVGLMLGLAIGWLGTRCGRASATFKG